MKTIFALALWMALLEEFIAFGSALKIEQGKLQQVVMKEYCGESYHISNTTAAVVLVPTESSWKPIAPCMKCPVTLVTESENHQLLATFYSLGLKLGMNGTCSQIRLDVFDGNGTSSDARISGAEGICGYALNSAPFISTSNSLTVQLTTMCPKKPSVFDTYELIVSTFKSNGPSCPGQFQCRHGQCIHPCMVCDGKSDCPDDSDEDGCSDVNTTIFPTWAIVILTLLTFAVMVLAAYIIYLVCASICTCSDKGYETI